MTRKPELTLRPGTRVRIIPESTSDSAVSEGMRRTGSLSDYEAIVLRDEREPAGYIFPLMVHLDATNLDQIFSQPWPCRRQDLEVLTLLYRKGKSLVPNIPKEPPAITAAVEFVRLGFQVSLNFEVDLRDRPTAEAVLSAAPDYNQFSPRRILASFEEIWAGAGWVSFGRESSPVLYITVPAWTGQRLGTAWTGIGDKLTTQARQEYARRVIEWGRAMDADGITVQQFPPTDKPVIGKPGDNPYEIRLWWD